MFRWVYFVVCLLGLSAWLVVSSPTGQAANEQNSGQARRVSNAIAAFNTGDVFAAVGNGKVKRFSPTGTLLQTLDSGSSSQDTAGMAFDPAGNLYSTQFTSNQIFKFDINGNLLGAFGSGLDAHPESIVIDKAQNFYIGHANGTRLVRKFNTAGTLLDTYALATEDRGSDWIDLAADQRTLFYTSEGKRVKRYDVVSKTQLPDFSTTPMPGTYAYALRILPGGGVIVADTQSIIRLDAVGNAAQIYDAPNEDNWFAVNLDPDGQTFWSGNLGTGKVYRFNIATGAILTSWDSGKFTSLSGLAVFGEITASQILRITKSAPATVTAGAQLTYTLSCGNTGTTNATSVVIKDTVPTGASFVSATDGGSLANGIVTWNLGTLNAGVTGRTISFTVSVSSALANGATLTNSNYSIEASGVAAVTGPPVTTTISGGGSSTCEYTVAPLTQAFSVAGGTGTINVTTSAECGWTATRSAAWLSVTTGNSGTGNGTVTYTVQANTSPSARVGGLLVAGRYVLITQAGSLGNCPVTPLTIPQTVNATLGTTDCRSVVDENAYADLYSFSGQAGQRIAIEHTTTAFDAYMILIAENGSIIGVNDDSNSTTTSSRIPAGSGFYVLPYTGTYIIEASSFNANETGSYTLSLTAATTGPTCTYAIAPTLAAFNAAGGDGSVAMTAPTGCEWTASALSSWITVNSGANGSGNGTINYTVGGNTSQGFRVGRLVIGGQFVTVVQGGTGGNCPITPVGVPSTTNAAWAVGDCASGSGGFSDLYSFSGQAGQRVSIETVTQATTTALYLYGPTGSFVVGYTGDATLRIPPGTGYYVLPYTGTYLIEANAGLAGNYTLNLNVPAVTPTCPTISGFTPASGAVGSTVTITGNNFTGLTAVRFANNVSAQFTVNSATQITATVPSGAVTGVITLSKTGCTDVQTSNAFTVTTSTVAELIDHAITGGPIPAECSPPPAKSNFAPTDERAYQWSSFVNVRQGDIVRWEFVQPNGTVYESSQRPSDFSGSACFWAWITIAGQQAASLPGDWQVRVSYNGTPILTERFRILPGTSNCPTVTSLSAAAGVAGSTITLTGANFTGVTAVKFANNVTAQFTINSDTSLTTVVPTGAVTGPITLSKPNCADTTTTIFIVTGGGACVTAPSGAIAWLPGDGNANDLTGMHNGTLQNGATATAAGKVGQAFSFDGVNDFVGLGTWSAGVQWTLEAWVNPASVPANRRAILGGMNDCNDWALVLQDGKWGVAIKPSSGACTETVTSGVAAVANTWHHLVATNDGTTARIYVNGELKGSGAVAAGATGTTAGTYIGGNVCCTEFFPGLVDEATIYNRALALTEVQGIYNAGSAGKCKTTTGCAVKADYQLQNTLSSSVGTPPVLTNLGSNTFGTATVDGASRTVLQFAKDNGVVLTPTTGVISNQVYTAVVLFSFSEISGYRRILDFKNNAEDSGLYNRDGFLVFFSGIAGANAVIPANTFVQVVLTRDAAKNVVGYVNGVQQFSFVDSGDAAVIDGNNKLIFFRDNSNNETSAGAVARIRVYDCALTPAEVGGLDRVPGQTPTCPIITGLNVNRLCNPGAELGAGATVKSQVVPLPGWTTTSNFTATRYDAAGSLTVEESQLIGGGTNFFYGGDVNASSTATQLVTLADEATGIDAGQRTVQLQAYLGGFGGDNAGIRAEFLNAGGTVLGTALVLGPRSDDMQLLSTTGQVPAGTRTIRVTMTATRVAGDDNEGYFDNLSLVLTQSGTTTCPTVTNLSPSSGAVGSTVTITGTNFTGVTAVRFANNVNAQFTVNSATQITATVPSGAVTGVMTLSKTGCTDVQTVPFTVTTAGPCIDVVIASNLTAGTGTTLTVPITVSDTTGKGAIAYDATLTYDPAVLRLQNPPTDKTGTLSSNFTITTNVPAAGQLRISGFGSTALTGAGVLLNVKFDVLGAANACSNLSFPSFRFNEGTPCSTTTNGRACVTGGGIISGAVSYCITPKPVPGAAINVTGSSSTSATTNSNGAYTLPNLNSGNYTLTPAKIGDVNGLASFDAALVAQHVVGIITLNSCQQLAGDTSNNGEQSSFDAALIAQYVVGINNAASIAGTWKFVPPTRTYTNLSSNQTNQNFDAVLVGDVSGNWAAGATAFDELARASGPAQQVSISLPNLSATTGTSVTIPITVGDLTGKGVIAYDFDLVFDQNVLQAQSTPFDAANTLSSALTITANPQPGRLRVSAFGTQSLAGAGTLLNLKFNVLGAGGTSSAVTWQRFLLNETVQTSLTNGRVSAGYAVACVSAASFIGTALASESIVAGFGQGLATRTEVGTTVPLPTTLAGTTVRIRDSAGIERLAPLFFVSSGQVNYQVPPGTAAGAATLIVSSGDGAISTGTLQIARVMPGLFAANSNGMGAAAAVALRVKTDGSQVYELVATYDAAQQRFVPLPLSLGPEGEQVYLILFGTGARNLSSLANVQTRVGGTEVPVAFVGAVEGLVGLDQLNLGPLPRSLAGRGEVSIAVLVDGQMANVVTVSVR